MVAGAAAAQGHLDALGAATAVCCGLLSLTALLAPRGFDQPGCGRVGVLGLCLAGVLLRVVAPRALSLGVDVSGVLAAAAGAALLVDLALTVPDSLGSPRVERALRGITYALCALGAVVGLCAHAPAVYAMGRLWLAPAWGGRVPDGLLVSGIVFALATRAWRRRAGSDAESLASNTWALIGLLPAALITLVAVAAVAAGAPATTFNVRAAQLAVACVLVFGHVRMLDPSRRAGVAQATRRIVPAVATLGLLAAAVVISRPVWPATPLLLAAGAVGLALLATAVHGALRDMAQRALDPEAARTLSALERGRAELNAASGLDHVARAALGAARRACGDPSSEPVLYLFHPPMALRLDAAGFPHADALPPHSELVRALRAEPRRILLRRDLDSHGVRSPSKRPLIEVLSFLQALCVLPLSQQGELEGALLFPRGPRQSEPSLEELEALRRFGDQLSAFVALLSAEARALRRAEGAQQAAVAAEAERARVQAELTRSAIETRALQLGGALAQPQRGEVAYSATMRALLEQLHALATSEAHVLLWAEPGTPLSPLLRHLHAASPRAERPLFTGDCAALPADGAASIVLGTEGEGLGWLQIARDGTLALFDLAALPLTLQRELAARLPKAPGEGQAAGVAPARLIAGCRADPRRLVAEGALDPTLVEHLVSLRVPPLRERAADLHSLILLALDRSARVLGREPVGIAPDAEARLRAHQWPGNLDELDSVITRAVAHCRGPRVGLDDLPALGAASVSARDGEGAPLDGTLEEIERRALVHALARTGGNKSEAARLLGLKRTTFLDKLRRHRLDGPPTAAVPN